MISHYHASALWGSELPGIYVHPLPAILHPMGCLEQAGVVYTHPASILAGVEILD